ncbi:NAD(P)H-dependent oxidoreductase subunit E [Paludisphaera sp.]|uniref:NADH-quinone oxidoreductase subunit NuoE family protein n=1 Tax=Paludisphaera sp. TaxID=2017432 RepID=UPI00301E3A91
MAAEAPAQQPPRKIAILTEPMKEAIRALFPRYPSKRAVTLPALHMVHEHYRCVPLQAMAEIAEILEIAPADVHDTMSFYGFFPQAPLGDVRVWVCRSISCMLRGGDELLGHACRRLGVERGETTPDGKLTVEFAECLGICDHAPAALADDGRVYGPLDEAGVDAMLDELKRGRKDEAPHV